MSKREFTVDDARRMIAELGKFNLTDVASILTPLYAFVERSTRVQQARATLELFFSAPMQAQTPEKVAEAVAFLVRGVAGVAGDPSALDDLLERVQGEIMAMAQVDPGDLLDKAFGEGPSTGAMTQEEIDALAAET